MQLLKNISLNNVKTRALLVFILFISILIIALVYNFVNFNAIKQIQNFEYWSIFYFAVYLLFAWKHWSNNKKIIFLKIFLTSLSFIFIVVFLSLPLANINIGHKIYNGIGIIVFSFGWIIEMLLFWNSHKQVKK